MKDNNNNNNNKEYQLPKDVNLAIYLLYSSSVFFLFFYGFCNTEDYESIISALVAQEYFHISKDMAFWDINILVTPFFAWINSFIPGVQIYGYYVLFMTILVGAIGLHLILNFKKLNQNKKILISLSYIALYTINLINLQSTRVAVLLVFIFLIHYTYNTLSRPKLALIFTSCIILRIDAVVLLSLSYIVICFILNRYKKIKIWLPFITSFTLLLILNFAIMKYGNEGVKNFYYYEIEIIDKQNIDFENISDANRTILDYLYKHFIFDENLHKPSFIKEVIAIDSGHFFNNIINPQLYINTLKRSIPAILEIKPFLIFSILLLFANFFLLKRLRYKLLLLYLFLFPLFICFYISVPTRFLYPYYSTFILLASSLIPYQKKIILILLAPVIIVTGQYASKLNTEYSKQRAAFQTTMHKINTLFTSYGDHLFFENFYVRSWRFTSTDVRHVYQKNKVHFINFAFFQYFDLYKNDWAKVDSTINYQSILEKIQYLEKNNHPLIIENKTYEKVYKSYLLERYNYKSTVQYIDWTSIQ